MSNFFWVICVLFGLFGASFSANPMRNCTISKTDSCPVGSICSQTVESSSDGICKCPSNKTFNENYTSDETYCVPATQPLAPTTTTTVAPTTPSTTTTTTTTTTTPPPKITTIAPTKAPEPEVIKEPVAPEPHHLLGGIMIPLFVVLAFIGAVFAVKRYDLIERSQDWIRERGIRRNRHNYTNHFDEFDDPLLI